MSSTQTITDSSTHPATTATIDQKLEVVVVPVADVDRAKRFYAGLGWRVDADFASGDSWRLVQMTPPGSSCSVMFGKGFTTAVPGSMKGTFLVVDNIDTARAQLTRQGVEVTDVFHFDGKQLVIGPQGRIPGRDPANGSYFSFASFEDPDGNGWLLQEVTARFPGRGYSLDAATMTGFLREAEEHHGAYEATSPKHHWSAWYSEYIVARHRGLTPEEAAAAGARRIESSQAVE